MANHPRKAAQPPCRSSLLPRRRAARCSFTAIGLPLQKYRAR